VLKKFDNVFGLPHNWISFYSAFCEEVEILRSKVHVLELDITNPQKNNFNDLCLFLNEPHFHQVAFPKKKEVWLQFEQIFD
jgi:hypothetical protein